MDARLRQLLDSLSIPDSESCWSPPTDVYQHRYGWLIKMALAGVRPQDVELSILGKQITISGIRRDLTIGAGHQAYSMEIAYNRFQRTIELPMPLENALIEKEHRDGMLIVAIRPRRTT